MQIIIKWCTIKSNNLIQGDDSVKRNKKGQFVKGSGIKDITGQRFGKLVAIELDIVKNRKSYWKVKCDCGNEKIVRSDTLKKITSCGCVKKEQDKINLFITNNHEMTRHSVYSIWHAMVSRCHNPNDHAYNDYGGRGIKVCEGWQDIKKFAKWADEQGFEKGKNLSIERIDVNGNYCPDNCCWIERTLQPRNRRNTIKFSINGIEKPLSEWSELKRIDHSLVLARYEKGCRNPEDLFYKGNLQQRDTIKVSVYGEMLSASDIATKYNINKQTVQGRIYRGITDEQRLLYKGNLKELK